MMKILHTADWHLGKKLESFSRLEEQQQVLEEICSLAETHDVDAILIAGDLYDTFKPATEVEELFYRTVKRLSADGKRAVIAIAGNHDSPDRVAVPEMLARECGIFLAGYPDSRIQPVQLESGLAVLRSDAGFLELKLPRHDAPLRILTTPYANELRLRTFLEGDEPEAELRNLLQQKWTDLAAQYCDDKGINILMAHLMMMRREGELPEEPDSERSIIYIGGAQAVYSENIPQGLQYVALGHLHRYQTIDQQPCPVVYSGSPLSYSMSEADQQKYVLLLEAEAAQPVHTHPLALQSGYQLCRVRFQDVESAVRWLQENPDTIVELTMETDTFLTPVERRQLALAHPRIIGPIPVVKQQIELGDNMEGDIDLDEPVHVLFERYFRSRHGQEPSAEIVDLFKDIILLDEDN